MRLLTILLVLISVNLQAQFTNYFDRTAWSAAAGTVCYTEDLESFSADTEFRTSPLSLNGFTIEQIGVDQSFRNQVDVLPFEFNDNNGTNNLSCFVEFDFPTEVLITFDEPIRAFFADYFGEAGNEILMQTFNDDMNMMVGEYMHSMNDETYGFVLDPNTPSVTSIMFSASSSDGGGMGGEGFGLDNIEIVCGAGFPIPTLTQWGLIILILSSSILGLIFIKNPSVITARN